jgi:DNA-binding NtrC family response regulator
MKCRTLLCVDDDPGIRELYEVVLGSYGYEVIVAASGGPALKLFHSQEIDVVLLDYEMPGMNGAQLAAELKRRQPGLPIIMISGHHPVLGKAQQFVNAAVAKGEPIEKLVDQIEILLEARTQEVSLPLA